MIFINKTKGNKMSTENNITLIECSHCNEEIEEDLRESNLCDPCEENTSVCVVCNERTDDDDINTVEDEQYCCDCVFDHYITCDGCGEWVDIDRYHYRDLLVPNCPCPAFQIEQTQYDLVGNLNHRIRKNYCDRGAQ